MKYLLAITILFISASGAAQSNAQKLAATAMNLWKDSFTMKPGQPAKWSYDQGVILKGIEGIWTATGNADYFRYIQKSMDFYVQEDGSIKGYKYDDFNIDHLNNGKQILLLYRVTGKEKYKKAAALLRDQLKNHPRTSEGGFWHKKIYPSQMWLDGLYMGQPFYAEYAKVFGEDTAFNDIAKQFILMERHARDPKTGLLYHGWDESREQLWANKTTGQSPHFWGRALGWYGMAMVDALDHFPENHPGRDSIISILNRFAAAVTAVQDMRTGLWYDVVDKKMEPRNYYEASATSMLVYTLAKGVRMGYLPFRYWANARVGYDGARRAFLIQENGQTNLHGTVSVSGLGGKPYRDGSFAYYMSEPVVVNDPKGMGAFINAAVEMEMYPQQMAGVGKTVLLDNYYNNEWKKEGDRSVPFHYTWDDRSNGGFSMLGDLFRMHGASTRTLKSAPTAEKLKDASMYIIVDPDTEKETAQPNFMKPEDVKVIADWVKAGGVLLLMGNDAGNAELDRFNLLALTFGISFNKDNYNLVIRDTFEQGAVAVPPGHSIFPNARKLFIKELATLQVKEPAQTVLQKENKSVIATAKYGRGSVLVIGDPWIYNEYIDGRKLPAEYTNHAAAMDLVKWMIRQSPVRKLKQKGS